MILVFKVFRAVNAYKSRFEHYVPELIRERGGIEPRLHVEQTPHGLVVQPVDAGELQDRVTASREQDPDVRSSCHRQLGRVDVLGTGVPSLCELVTLIVLVGAEEQIIRIHASPVVAAMANVQPVRDRTDMVGIRESVRRLDPTL